MPFSGGGAGRGAGRGTQGGGGHGRGARAKAKARVARFERGNVRAKARQQAVAAMSALAAEVDGPKLRVKAPARQVEAVIRMLDRLCHAPEHAARLRAAVDSWTANGGHLHAALAPVVPHVEGDADMPCCGRAHCLWGIRSHS